MKQHIQFMKISSLTYNLPTFHKATPVLDGQIWKILILNFPPNHEKKTQPN